MGINDTDGKQRRHRTVAILLVVPTVVFATAGAVYGVLAALELFPNGSVAAGAAAGSVSGGTIGLAFGAALSAAVGYAGFRFTARDLLWLTALAGLAISWGMDRTKTAAVRMSYRNECTKVKAHLQHREFLLDTLVPDWRDRK